MRLNSQLIARPYNSVKKYTQRIRITPKYINNIVCKSFLTLNLHKNLNDPTKIKDFSPLFHMNESSSISIVNKN